MDLRGHHFGHGVGKRVDPVLPRGCGIPRFPMAGQVDRNEAVAAGKGAVELLGKDLPRGARAMQHQQRLAQPVALAQADRGTARLNRTVMDRHCGAVIDDQPEFCLTVTTATSIRTVKQS